MAASALVHLRPSELLDPDQAAAYAGVAPSTIRQWKHRGLLAPAIPGDGHRTRHLYAKPDLDRVKRQLAAAQAARTAPPHATAERGAQRPAPAIA
ncbi:MerR family transcriptional regulator [Streptomyces bullii]|uniref:MerR family transcriptional regulator n=1 Tax=Streptomyces bullii TaxID=349910 RepID=A0ABW0USC4_9ACTN